MKGFRKILAVVIAVAMAVTAVPAVNVQDVQAKTGLPSTKSCYETVLTKLSLTVPSSWKNIKTTWSVKKGTPGAVSLSAKKNKSVKIKGTKAGSAIVYAKVSYTKNGKEKTSKFSTNITVKEQGSAPTLVKVEKAYDYLAVHVILTFDKAVSLSDLYSGKQDILTILTNNFEIKMGDTVYSSKSSYSNKTIDVNPGENSKQILLSFYEDEDQISKIYNSTITASIKSTATLKGANGKKLSASDSALTASIGKLDY